MLDVVEVERVGLVILMRVEYGYDGGRKYSRGDVGKVGMRTGLGYLYLFRITLIVLRTSRDQEKSIQL